MRFCSGERNLLSVPSHGRAPARLTLRGLQDVAAQDCGTDTALFQLMWKISG